MINAWGLMLKTRFKKLSVEEVANTLTHGFGLFLSVVGFVFLVVMASIKGDAWHLAASIVYGLSLIVLYAASTFYHGATSPKLKSVLQIVDHCCIYLLIAGSYTPFALIVLRESLGYGLFFLIWAFAAAGILLKIFFGKRFPAVSVISYLLMGWMGAFAVQPLLAALGLVPVALIIAGGIAYSLGVIFFAWERIPHHHAIWHVFVLAGSIFHYLAIAIYVVPYVVNL